MSYIYHNLNPKRRIVGDCVIRAIAQLTDTSWEDTFIGIALKGFEMRDMPTSNQVWGAYLFEKGYVREPIGSIDYTVIDFCADHPKGSFLLATGDHTVAVYDGDYYDTWDSGDEIPIYFWFKETVNGRL